MEDEAGDAALEGEAPAAMAQDRRQTGRIVVRIPEPDDEDDVVVVEIEINAAWAADGGQDAYRVRLPRSFTGGSTRGRLLLATVAFVCTARPTQRRLAVLTAISAAATVVWDPVAR